MVNPTFTLVIDFLSLAGPWQKVWNGNWCNSLDTNRLEKFSYGQFQNANVMAAIPVNRLELLPNLATGHEWLAIQILTEKLELGRQLRKSSLLDDTLQLCSSQSAQFSMFRWSFP